ncbi:galectin-3-binding protein-like isoform X2 [Ambystoma mexicanum]
MDFSRMIGRLLPLWITLFFLACGLSTAFKNGDVRLVGGSQSNEGRVEVYYGEQWGTVCDDNWDLKDADVVCRSLGFENATQAVMGGKYGQGTGPILLDDVTCTGTESSLAQCKSKGLGKNDCSHAEDAGVICTGRTQKLFKDSQTYELDHSSEFSECLNKLYNRKQDCDLSIVAVTPGNDSAPQTFCTHKLILSMNIEAGFLLKAAADTYTMVVESECMPYVDSFIRYLYTKKIEMSSSSVKCIHKMASTYGVTALQEYCGQLFALVLPADSTFKTQLDLYSYAISSDDALLEGLCLQYLAWNCEAFSQSAAWLRLTSEQLRALLSRTDVVVPSELFLLKALESWRSVQNPGNESTQKLIKEIRFPMMQPEQLFELQFNLSIYKNFEPIFQEMVLQALEFHTVTFAKLKQHKDLGKDMYLPRIYTSTTWSYHMTKLPEAKPPQYNPHQYNYYNQYGHMASYNPATSFTTPKHNSFVFNNQQNSWTVVYLADSQDCANNGYTCSSTNVPILGLRLSSSTDASIQYENKAIFLCQGSYISDVQDFKQSMSIVPTNSTGSFPCPDGYAKYVYVVRPVYLRND